MPIRATCQCGKSFQAPDSLAGKTVKCPACGSQLVIPRASDSGFFEELSDLEAAAHQATSASSSGLGGSLSAAASGANLSSSSLSMGTLKKESSIPMPAIVIGCVIGVTCLALIVVLLVGGSGSENSDVGRQQAQPVVDSVDTQGNAETSAPRDDDEDTTAAVARSDNSEGTDSQPDEQTPADADAPGPRTRGGRPSQPARGGTSPSSSAGTSEDENQPDRDEGQPADSPDSKYIRTNLIQGAMKWHGGNGALIASRKIDTDDTLEYQYGWMVELLPHLGYQDEYDKLDFKKKWREEPNSKIATLIIPEFLNPADEEHRFVGAFFGGLAVTHFVGMSGVEDIEKEGRNFVAAELPRDDPRAGIFGYTDIAERKQITDGIDKTIMLIGGGDLRTPWISAGGSTVRGLRLSTKLSWCDERTGLGSIGHGKRGAAAMMADGSVRWIDANVDTKLLRAMCTTHGSDSADLTELTVNDPQGRSGRIGLDLNRERGRPAHTSAQRDFTHPGPTDGLGPQYLPLESQ